MKDHKKESFCRAMLLSIDPERQLTNLEERKKAVVRNMRACILDLLSPAQFHEVRMSLENIVAESR
jgi:hypothetical protein